MNIFFLLDYNILHEYFFFKEGLYRKTINCSFVLRCNGSTALINIQQQLFYLQIQGIMQY